MYSSLRTSVTPLNEEASLGILKHLNKDELSKLLDDDGKLVELIKDDQQVRRIDIDKDNLIANNRSVAEYNLSQEPKLASSKQLLGRTYEASVKVQKEYDEKKQKLDCKSSQYSLDTVCALLQTEAAKSDDHSEKIAEEFLEGSIEIDVFLERYIPQRTIAHERKVKSEKLVEMVRSGATSVPSPYGHNTAPIPAPRPSTYTTPYPTGNVPMPQLSNYLPR